MLSEKKKKKREGKGKQSKPSHNYLPKQHWQQFLAGKTFPLPLQAFIYI